MQEVFKLRELGIQVPFSFFPRQLKNRYLLLALGPPLRFTFDPPREKDLGTPALSAPLARK